jgi:hypothetical protein
LETRELAAAMEAGPAAMALCACALEQSERERSEDEQIGEGERGHWFGLHTCANPRWRVEARMEHGSHASSVFCPGHPSSPLCFEWRDSGESDEIEPKRIFVWWVKYVDTMRPRSVLRLDERQLPTVEHYRTVIYKLS